MKRLLRFQVGAALTGTAQERVVVVPLPGCARRATILRRPCTACLWHQDSRWPSCRSSPTSCSKWCSRFASKWHCRALSCCLRVFSSRLFLLRSFRTASL